MTKCEICDNVLIPGTGACLVCLGIADEDGNINGGKGRVRKLEFGTLASFRNRFEEYYLSVSREIQQEIDKWKGMERGIKRTKEEKDHLRRIGGSIWRRITDYVNDPENQTQTEVEKEKTTKSQIEDILRKREEREKANESTHLFDLQLSIQVASVRQQFEESGHSMDDDFLAIVATWQLEANNIIFKCEKCEDMNHISAKSCKNCFHIF